MHVQTNEDDKTFTLPHTALQDVRNKQSRPNCWSISTILSPQQKKKKKHRLQSTIKSSIHCFLVDGNSCAVSPSNEWLIYSCMYDICFGSYFSMHFLYLWIVVLGKSWTHGSLSSIKWLFLYEWYLYLWNGTDGKIINK